MNAAVERVSLPFQALGRVWVRCYLCVCSAKLQQLLRQIDRQSVLSNTPFQIFVLRSGRLALPYWWCVRFPSSWSVSWKAFPISTLMRSVPPSELWGRDRIIALFLVGFKGHTTELYIQHAILHKKEVSHNDWNAGASGSGRHVRTGIGTVALPIDDRKWIRCL